MKIVYSIFLIKEKEGYPENVESFVVYHEDGKPLEFDTYKEAEDWITMQSNCTMYQIQKIYYTTKK